MLPARGTPGVSPDGEGSWDAAAAVAAAVLVAWKFRSTFWLGNYIWSLSVWNWTQMRHLGTSVPGLCTEFWYLLYGQSGLAGGAIFEKCDFFSKYACPFFREQGARMVSAEIAPTGKEHVHTNIHICICIIRRPLLARGHQAARNSVAVTGHK